MRNTNQIGSRGETAAIRCFARPVSGHYGFETAFLGDKAQLLDLRVALLDRQGKVFGPHFYAQIKTRQARRGLRFGAGFGGQEITSAKSGLVPVYLVGVELDGDTNEDVWVCGIQDQNALPSFAKAHDLKATATLLQIYEEVLGHFQSATYSFTTILR